MKSSTESPFSLCCITHLCCCVETACELAPAVTVERQFLLMKAAWTTTETLNSLWQLPASPPVGFLL